MTEPKKRGRKTKAEKLAHEARMQALRDKPLPPVLPTPEHILREDRAIFASLGSRHLPATNWTPDLILSLEERLKQAGDRIHNILTVWDEIAIKEAWDNPDNKLTRAYETVVEKIQRWRYDGILWEAGSSKTLNQYIQELGHKLPPLSTYQPKVRTKRTKQPRQTKKHVESKLVDYPEPTDRVHGGQQTGWEF